jgi:CHAD domain-containing protein
VGALSRASHNRLPPEPKPLGAGAPAGEVVRNAIATSTRRLLEHEAGVRSGDDPEDIHQARVACRRLRSDLRTFSSLLDQQWMEATRAELRWLGGLLGEVRDQEVLRDRLRGHAQVLPEGDRPAAERLIAGLDETRGRSRQHLLQAIRSDRYLALVDCLLAASQAPPLLDGAPAPAVEVLVPSVAQAWRKLRKAVRRIGPEPEDADLHQVRIRAKRSRYAAEAVAPVVPKAAKFAAAVADLQTVLGEHQDAVVAQAWLREEGTQSGPGLALAAGELVVVEDAARLAARRRWRKAWKRARRRKLRSWLASG